MEIRLNCPDSSTESGKVIDMVLPTVPNDTVIQRRTYSSAASYNLGAGCGMTRRCPGVVFASQQRGRMAGAGWCGGPARERPDGD
ncbi:hypothetical protein [Nocardia sp. CNY236]|uniref:hypothetical protein n=1 Tax=Nocardia sp. CNY236 TaxID=1169152 RepID=UPI0018CBCF82|nr:hypothetical protein [Nocardia sp. CNY236]